MWVVIDGVVWGEYTVDLGNTKVSTMNFVFPGLLMLVIATLTLTTVSITICSDRLEKRLKQLALSKITIFKYLLGLFLFNYLIYFADFLIMFIIALAAFDLQISVATTFVVLLVPIILFLIHFAMAIIIASNSKTIKSNLLVTLIIFYILIFLSGATLPTYLFPEWWKWIQIFLPSGSGVLLLTRLFNGIGTAEIWYTYLILGLYTALFSFLAFKTFKWC
ncbi:hypothetical protein SCLARK_001395 [Spiroplasma clarkii]|nr:ABC transporter permease [Spiroplasma clarkii]ARU91920.1 hypothetical protein SCLARK_001395 [Spiroplasma clarkii]